MDEPAPHVREGCGRRARHPVRHRQPGRALPGRVHEGHRLQARAPRRPRHDRPRRQLVCGASVDDRLRRAAEAARGFMPPDEGLALYEAASSVTVDGPMLEIGSYCGKSAIYLGAAAQQRDTVLFSRRPPSRIGGEPAGLGVARARPGRPCGRQDRHAADLPAHDPRRGARGHRRGASSPTRRRWPRTGDAARAALHRRRPRHRARPPRLRAVDPAGERGRPARDPRRVLRTRPTADGRPTRSTAAPSSRDASRT